MYIIITNYGEKNEQERTRERKKGETEKRERRGGRGEGEGEGKRRRRDKGEIQKHTEECVMVDTLTLTWNVMAQKTNTVEDLAWSEMIEKTP